MKRKQAFTLIELLVVISIIALLIGILLPALSAARETAKSSVCKSSLRQIAIADAAYRADHKQWRPAAFGQPSPWNIDAAETFMTSLAPYSQNTNGSDSSFGDTIEGANNYWWCPVDNDFSYDDSSYGSNIEIAEAVYNNNPVETVKNVGGTDYTLTNHGMVDVDKANIQASSTVSYGDKDFLRIQAYGSNALRTNDVTVFGDFRHNSDVAMDRNTPVLTAANGGGFANYNFFDGHVASATVMDFVNDPSQFDSWIFGDLQSVNAPSGW